MCTVGNQGKGTTAEAGPVVDQEIVVAEQTLISGAFLAGYLAIDAGESIGVGGDGAGGQTLTLIQQSLSGVGAVETLLAREETGGVGADLAALDGGADIVYGGVDLSVDEVVG